jgi:hypothetical protein
MVIYSQGYTRCSSKLASTTLTTMTYSGDELNPCLLTAFTAWRERERERERGVTAGVVNES